MKLLINSPQLDAIDYFVDQHPNATPAHQSAWINILQRGMGQRPYSLSTWRDGQVVGYLPLVLTRSMLFGRYLVSLPYVNEAGLLADDHEAANALLQTAAQLGHKYEAKYVELRNRASQKHVCLTSIRTDKLRMTAPLPCDEQTLWKQIHSKARNQVRKAQKHNLEVHWGHHDLLNQFYHVFATNMRDLGTPVFPRRLFKAMLDELGDGAELCVITKDNHPIAGAIMTHFKKVSEVPSASSLRSYNHTCCNMLLYWHLLLRATQRGSEIFDFGRSTINSGTYKFKTQWGATGQPTNWQQIALTDQAKPLTKEDDQFSTAIKVWQKLPVWVTRIAGPQVVKGIP